MRLSGSVTTFWSWLVIKFRTSQSLTKSWGWHFRQSIKVFFGIMQRRTLVWVMEAPKSRVVWEWRPNTNLFLFFSSALKCQKLRKCSKAGIAIGFADLAANIYVGVSNPFFSRQQPRRRPQNCPKVCKLRFPSTSQKHGLKMS